MRLIHCQAGNPRSAALAVAYGWGYGARSDDTIYPLAPLAMLDIDWKEPDWSRHLDRTARYRPWLAVVPDVMSETQLDRALRQAEELAPCCERLMIVPKAPGIIPQLPRFIGGRAVVLGYSVPTSYGGTELGLWDFVGWPVHLLGGNPRRQKELCGYLDVESADGNLVWRLARKGIVVTERGVAGKTLRQLDGERWPQTDAPLEALRRSFVNLRVFWGQRAFQEQP